MASISLRIDFSELDMFGHVNNVMFLKYIQSSRVNYWEVSGIMVAFTENRVGPMLASVTCNFIKPLFYPGNLRIEANMRFIKNTSFGLKHRIFNDKDELVAEAEDIMVMYDFKKEEKVRFPDNFRKSVSLMENRSFDDEEN